MPLEIPIIRHETDVLIVGGGAAGTMAAFECANAGVAVIQATKGRATSGTTTVARGGFAAAMGKDDSPELHLRDILKHGGELIDPELARVWVYDIIDVVHDLEVLGSGICPSPGRRTRSQGVSHPLSEPSVPSSRHYRQHDHQGVVEKATRRRAHSKAFDHCYCRFDQTG